MELIEETIDCAESVVATTTPDVQITETVDSAETVNTYIDGPPTWVAGPYRPTSDVDRKRPAFTDRDCLLAS